MSYILAEQNINKRTQYDYDLLNQTIMKLRKQNVLNELEILKLTGKSVIFENQEIIAYKVMTAFKDRKIINIMVISKTQSGKTGSMCATIKQYLEDTNNLIPIDNIYIITGLSSCEWKAQTKERMPESIQSRVYHRSELPNTFVDEIKDKKNILIIMDEIQVAAKKGQTIYNTFKAAGLLNKQFLYENDIKILEYTATPDGTIYDLMKWKDASTKILAEVGDGYISSYNLLHLKRVKQYKNLCTYNIKDYLLQSYKTHLIDEEHHIQADIEFTIVENYIISIIMQTLNKNNIDISILTDFINKNKTINVNLYNDFINMLYEIYCNQKVIFESIKAIKVDVDNYTLPKYHIIRTKNGIYQDITLEHFKLIFSDVNYNFIKYDRESEIEDINNTLKIIPLKHTIIFIKEMLRCAKTLNKKNLGVSYERYCDNPDDAAIVQGLIGRNTGYDDNGVSICYTNIDSIERYELLWKSNFEDKTIKWKSKTTRYSQGMISGKDTFNDPKYYDGFLVESDESDESETTIEPVIKKFKTQEEVKEYYNKELKKIMKGRGPNKVKPNDAGYYEATIRSIKKIYTCDEIKCERKQGLIDNNYRFYPCYEDVNNKDTLQWWLIYYT